MTISIVVSTEPLLYSSLSSYSMVQCIAVLMMLLSALTLHEVTSETNFYDLLNIKKDADNREIRKAFKQLALKMHPDKNPVSYDLLITCGNAI